MRKNLVVLLRTLGACLLLLGCGWKASARTSSNSPAIHTNVAPTRLVQSVERLETAGHPLTFGLDRIEPLRQATLLGEPLWKYAASLIYVLLAFYVAKLIGLFAQAWLRRSAKHSQSRVHHLIVALLHGPLKVIAFIILLNIGLSIFDWSSRAQLVLSKALVLVLAAAVTYLAVKVLALLLDVWRQRVAAGADRKLDDQLFSFLRKCLITFVIIVAAMVTAQNLGMNITAIITSLSIGGLAVGLAAQDTLANLFGAVAILADKPFTIGDTIKLDGAEGTVEAVGLRSTRLRDPDGRLITVPNKNIASANITNITRRPNIKTQINLVLARALPPDKVNRAVALLDEIYRSHPMTQDVWVSFNQFNGANLGILVIHWWRGTDYKLYLSGLQELNLAVKQKFDSEKIDFA